MWGGLREALTSGAIGLALLGWLFVSVWIAVGPLGVTPARGHLWIVIVIFLAPVFPLLVGEELVHRIRKGPQAPGRHPRRDAR